MALSKCITKGKELQTIQESITESGEMDPTLWGDLQNHIDMKMVYEKLPLQAFFLLRRVCKSWNAIACEHRNFKERIPKPYFVSMPFSWSKPNILAFDIPSGRWVWKQLGQRNVPLKPQVPALALHALLYSTDSSRMSRKFRSYVFDGHTDKEYVLPPFRKKAQEHPWDGIVVDTTVTPHGFKIVRGDVKFGTQIFDSEENMWTRNFSQPLRKKPPHLTTCANFNGSVYIRSVAPDIITVYDLEKAVWSELQPPEQLPGCRTYGGSLGTWQGKLLTIVEHHNGESFDFVVICEHDGETQQWKKFLAMPTPFYKNYCQGADDVIWSSFCEEYVLIVAWHYRSGEFDQPRAVCLGNMATRMWEVFSGETVTPVAEAGPVENGDVSYSEILAECIVSFECCAALFSSCGGAPCFYLATSCF